MKKTLPYRVNTRTGLNLYACYLDYIAGRMGEDDCLIILPHPQGWQIEYYIGQRKIIKKAGCLEETLRHLGCLLQVLRKLEGKENYV